MKHSLPLILILSLVLVNFTLCHRKKLEKNLKVSLRKEKGLSHKTHKKEKVSKAEVKEPHNETASEKMVADRTRDAFFNTGNGNRTAEVTEYGPGFGGNGTFNFSRYFDNGDKPLVLNSIGNEVDVKTNKTIMLTTFPYTITRCDQVVKFKGKFIVDMNEYRHREDAWFTLTAYYTNMYKDEQANKLVRSILMTESPQMPYHPKGAMPCVIVPSPQHGDKDITICVETKEQMFNILDVLRTFKDDCRGGGDKLNKLKVTRGLLNCMHNGRFEDPQTLLRRLRAKHYRAKDPKEFTRKWFHPGSDRIPGSPPPKPPSKYEELMRRLADQTEHDHDSR